jgi:hypothetical protein
MKMIWFSLKWSLLLALTGVLSYAAFSAGNTLVGFLIIAVFAFFYILECRILVKRYRMVRRVPSGKPHGT